MWETTLSKLALLELLSKGSLKRRIAQAEAWDSLAELPWTKRTSRKDEIKIVESHRGDIIQLLYRIWPDWENYNTAFTQYGLQPGPDGWAKLEDIRRAERLPCLPDTINRHTAAALLAPHSKSSLTPRRSLALGDTTTRHDGSIRIRPPQGLQARTTRGMLNLSEVAGILGEASLTDRSIREELSFEGEIRAVLLIENLGAFCDLPFIDGWLYAHMPGWDLATVECLLHKVKTAPVVHFGDLDPNGVRIHQSLESIRPDLLWFIPEFWSDLVATKGLSREWPDDLELEDTPELIRELARIGMWLEQETIVLDPRTPGALAKMI